MKMKAKKLSKNKDGFIGYASLFTIFSVVVILVITGTYGWQKYLEVKYPEQAAKGEIKGPYYYLGKIKDKVGEILKSQGVRNDRALELAADTKKISDPAGQVTLTVPAPWKMTANEAGKSGLISRVDMQSAYFSTSEEDGENGKLTYLDSGASFSAQIIAGENPNRLGLAEGKNSIIEKYPDEGIGGKAAKFYRYKNSLYPNAEILETNLSSGGKTYLLSLIFNRGSFGGAEYTFKEIVETAEIK